MKFLQIKETCIYFSDLEAARYFYHELLELPIIDYAEGRHVFFRLGTSVLLCFNPEDSRMKISPPAHYGFGKLHMAFEVARDDYPAWKKKILDMGIAILDTVIWETGQESFYFSDPAGNVLEIVPEGIWG